jgi:hypothetical protein
VDVLVETTTEVDSCVEDELGLGAAVVAGAADEDDGNATAFELVAGFTVVVALLAVEDEGGVPVTRMVPFYNAQTMNDQYTDLLHVGRALTTRVTTTVVRARAADVLVAAARDGDSVCDERTMSG